VLSYRVSVEALIEIALWLAVPYLTIGRLWSFFHPEGMQRIQAQLLPAGSSYELAALGGSTLLWPEVLLLPSDKCGQPQ
jgi:hypothetical protein